MDEARADLTGRQSRWEESRRLHEQSRRYLAGGVSSNVRLGREPWPLFFERGEGPYLYDVDGNVYVDYLLGQGPNILGHRPPQVVAAVRDALEEGQLYAGQHRREIELSRRLCHLIPCAELVRFGTSGSEIVHAALRLARAYTGRERIIKFEGHYHGWFDDVLVSVHPPLEAAGPRQAPATVPVSRGQAADAFHNVSVLPWNDEAVLAQALQKYGESVAAIIMEPMMCNTHAILPAPGYLQTVRRLCDDYGIVLIFDEVITGFRLGLSGAQGRFGVTPDLALFGKAMAGGFPVSCLAGRESLMLLIADGSVVHSGTFNSNVLAMAAAEATTLVLSDKALGAYEQMEQVGQALMEGIREIGARVGYPMYVDGLPAAFAVAFGEGPAIRDYRDYVRGSDQAAYHAFARRLLAAGIHVAERGVWYLSTAHSPSDVEQTLEMVEEALKATVLA